MLKFSVSISAIHDDGDLLHLVNAYAADTDECHSHIRSNVNERVRNTNCQPPA